MAPMSSPMPAMTTPQTPIPAVSASGLHTILGANGVIARELSLELGRQGLPVRQVSRHPRAVNPADQLQAADLLDAQAVSSAVAGSQVVYLVAGLAYDTSDLGRSVAHGHAHMPSRRASATGRGLCSLTTCTPMGGSKGAMTEETPFNPCSRKGEVRAAVATQLLNAMAQRPCPGD